MSVTAVPLQPIKKGSLAKLWVGIAIVILAAIALAWITAGSVRDQFQTNEDYLEDVTEQDGVVVTDSGLRYKFIEKGDGAIAEQGGAVTVNYEGRLRDGTVFDKNDGAVFPVGGTILGFDEALQLAPGGSTIEVWIPPALAYGDQEIPNQETGEPLIPADSVLNFTFEVLEVKSPAEVQQMMQMQQQMMEQMQQQQGGAPAQP